MFREYAAGRKGVGKDNLVEMMGRLAVDECTIGKVPDVNELAYESLFAKWDTNEDNLVSWHEFCEGCN